MQIDWNQTINDILSGTIDGSCDLIAAVSGHVQGGSVKALAVAADERSPVLGMPAIDGDGRLARDEQTGGDGLDQRVLGGIERGDVSTQPRNESGGRRAIPYA